MVEFSMDQYLVQMETRLQASQTALETRLETAQASLKRDLQAAQVKSEERIHSNNQLMISSMTYKALFIGIGTAVAGFTFLEGMTRGLGYELFTLKKSG